MIETLVRRLMLRAVIGLLSSALLIVVSSLLLLVLLQASPQERRWQSGPMANCTPLTVQRIENKTGTEYQGDWQCVQLSPAQQTRVARS